MARITRMEKGKPGALNSCHWCDWWLKDGLVPAAVEEQFPVCPPTLQPAASCLPSSVFRPQPFLSVPLCLCGESHFRYRQEGHSCYNSPLSEAACGYAGTDVRMNRVCSVGRPRDTGRHAQTSLGVAPTVGPRRWFNWWSSPGRRPVLMKE